MSDFLHIHLPFGDEGIRAIEEALGIKFQRAEVPIVVSEKVEVCPMSLPTGKVEFMKLRDGRRTQN